MILVLNGLQALAILAMLFVKVDAVMGNVILSLLALTSALVLEASSVMALAFKLAGTLIVTLALNGLV